ncbi:MAG: molybdenum cofactor biosynthesis protein MoaA [Thermoprotei archaeon]|nr:MAG: molybdenum cofactor biosynthesis protein MoaA [Thermoprotei archaeon]
MEKGYDPVERAERVKKIVCRQNKGVEERLYYRFRGGKWYGGIASADVIGCNLSCKFCWAYYFRDDTSKGKWYSPYEASSKLLFIAKKRGYKYVRLTGGEPTICCSHLLDLASDIVNEGLYFIVETNGILLGYDRTLAKRIASIERIIVRVSFKGVTPEEFHWLTGAKKDAWYLQLRALKNLIDSGLEPGEQVYAAAMIGWSRDEDIKWFLEKLSEIDPALIEVDWEYVILYDHVVRMLKKMGLWPPKRAVTPDGIPKWMI